MGYHKTTYLLYGIKLPRTAYEDTFKEEYGFDLDSKLELVSLGDGSSDNPPVETYVGIAKSVVTIDDHGINPTPAIKIGEPDLAWKALLAKQFPDDEPAWYVGTYGG